MKYSTTRHNGGVNITVDGRSITPERAAQIMETLEKENRELKMAAKELADKAGSISFSSTNGGSVSDGDWIMLNNATNKIKRLVR